MKISHFSDEYLMPLLEKVLQEKKNPANGRFQYESFKYRTQRATFHNSAIFCLRMILLLTFFISNKVGKNL